MIFKNGPREDGGFGDRLSVYTVRTLAALPWSLAIKLAGILGFFLTLTNIAKPYRIAKINLALCLPSVPENERVKLAKSSVVSMVKNVVAGAISWVAPTSSMNAKISQVEGEDLLQSALGHGRGVIFISPHMGCWEFINFYLCSRFDLVILAKPFGGPLLNELIEEGRSRLRGTLVPTNEKGVRALLGALKKGGMSYMTPDHVPKDGAGLYAPFFGVSTTTGILPSRLVQKTGAVVLAVTCTLTKDNAFLIRFIAPDPSIYSDDLKISVAGLNLSIEKCIRTCPDQYQWSYRRFKDIEGGTNPY